MPNRDIRRSAPSQERLRVQFYLQRLHAWMLSVVPRSFFHSLQFKLLVYNSARIRDRLRRFFGGVCQSVSPVCMSSHLCWLLVQLANFFLETLVNSA